MRKLLLFATIGSALMGCDPRFIEQGSQIDVYVGQGRISAACVGMTMYENDKLRKYTAETLTELTDDPVAFRCVCDSLYTAGQGVYDEAAADGIAGSARDDLATCLIPALNDSGITGDDRLELVRRIGAVGADVSYAAVAGVLDGEKDDKIRIQAIKSLLPARDKYRSVLLSELTGSSSPEARAEVAEVFGGDENQEVVDTLVRLAREDTEGAVRAAALRSVVKLRLPITDEMVCDLMINDADERVRDRAVRSFKGSKRDLALDCLEKRIKTEEESAMVRESVMNALAASPNDRAAKILCDSLGPFIRRYVDDKVPDGAQGMDILTKHNNRDFNNSYECIAKARRTGGYSCHGANYVARWFNKVGGKVRVPCCAGMQCK